MTTPPVTVYPARLVRTMDPARPTAEAVAVVGDRIRAVGSMAEMTQYPGTTVDDRYADAVLFPGFVEAHAHPFGGSLWEFTYVGRYDAMSPDGRVWPGCDSTQAVLARLREVDATLPDGEPLLAWGLDPIHFPGERLDKRHLDSVSRTRPIAVMHQSFHLKTVGSRVLEDNDITRDTPVEGVVRGADGEPNGELREFAAMGLVRTLPSMLAGPGGFPESAFHSFGLDARNHGITTLTDLGNRSLVDDAYVAAYRAVVETDDYPARISSFLLGAATDATSLEAAARRVVELRSTNGDKLRFGHVKLVLDGSIQGFTARLQPPGYLPDDRQGIWVMAPEAFADAFGVFHAAGLTVHVHCNGDEATELFLETVEQTLERHPRWNHRHTVTHSQLTTAAQYRRMGALGMCANLFSNHLWYWGDQHRDAVLGPDRASRMNGAATAARCGVPFALHCDSPVTPLDPLATASFAAARTTPSGQVLGEHERISVPLALEAVTLGAAYTLKMDHEVGSIEAGKYADFAVLDRDPFVLDAAGLRDVTVHGTALGGRHFPVGP